MCVIVRDSGYARSTDDAKPTIRMLRNGALLFAKVTRL
jgi:hypothetical protein